MEVIYLANVGTRDVTYRGKWLENPRIEGEELYKNYYTEKENIYVPILIPGIERILNSGVYINRLYIFVTEQPAYVEDKYRSKDTVFLGKIIEKYLHYKYGVSIGLIGVESISGNPANYNDMLDFYNKSIRAIAQNHSDAMAYVAPVGGVDACNVGLMINSIRYFKENCQPMYIFPDGKAEVINLHEDILEDYARKQAEAFLNNYDFEALKEVLADLTGGDDKLFYLAEYALCRLHFDFSKADEALKNAYKKASGESRLHISRIQETLSPFLTELNQPTSADDENTWGEWLEKQRYLVAELYYNLFIKAEKGEWVDFLGRLFRLQEALLRYVFEYETKHATEKIDSEFKDFVKACRNEPGLNDYLKNKKVNITPNVFVLTLIVTYWAGQKDKRKHYSKLEGMLGDLEKLSPLRNKSIIAHGYEGISKIDIEVEIKKSVQEFLEQLKQVFITLGINVDSAGPIEGVRQWLKKELNL